MEFFLELLFQLFGELILQLFVELFFRPFLPEAPTYKDDASPLSNTIAFGIMGAVCGGVSLLLFRHLLIRNRMLQLANLFGTPLILGALVSYLGRRRANKGLEPFPIDKFLYGFIFALAFGVIRYIGGR